ncbi:hypothetical protein AB1N83_008037 [Pleurotus pulmonarius]
MACEVWRRDRRQIGACVRISVSLLHGRRAAPPFDATGGGLRAAPRMHMHEDLWVRLTSPIYKANPATS